MNTFPCESLSNISLSEKRLCICGIYVKIMILNIFNSTKEILCKGKQHSLAPVVHFTKTRIASSSKLILNSTIPNENESFCDLFHHSFPYFIKIKLRN